MFNSMNFIPLEAHMDINYPQFPNLVIPLRCKAANLFNQITSRYCIKALLPTCRLSRNEIPQLIARSTFSQQMILQSPPSSVVASFRLL